jgi:hypothetical protein
MPNGRSLKVFALAVTLVLGSSLVASAAFPARVFAPYVQTWKGTNLVNTANASGHKFFTMAFILAMGSSCQGSWNGTQAISAPYFYASDIAGLRAIGGDVAFSFGGASGTELAAACTTVSSLQAAYQSVIDIYGLTWVDFDIEGTAISDTATIDRRNKALALLESVNPSLKVSYTLGVMPNGLPAAQVALLTNAKANGVRVDTVNIMAMDYGKTYASDMAQYAISATQATHNQLTANGLTSSVGITPMIGQNDTSTEVFTLANASTLESWAQSTPYVGELAFWANERDNGSCPGKPRSGNCSSLTQKTWDFSHIFEAFN